MGSVFVQIFEVFLQNLEDIPRQFPQKNEAVIQEIRQCDGFLQTASETNRKTKPVPYIKSVSYSNQFLIQINFLSD